MMNKHHNKMHKKLLSAFTVASVAAIGYFNLNYSSNPPVDYTGRSSANCTSCHSGTLNPSGGSLNTTGTTSYYPGRTYTFRITVNGGSRYGFEMTSVQQSSTSTASGTFSTGTGIGVTTLSGLSFARHTTTNTTGIWDVIWTAPASNPQNTRFYITGNAANNDFSTSGDKIYTATYNLTALSLINFSVITDSVRCNSTATGKARVVNPIGGAGGPYKYKWSAGTSIIADSLTGLTAGAYSVTVYDADSNSAVQSFQIRQPLPISKNPVILTSRCADSTGSISVAATGGNGGFSYTWSNMHNGSSISQLRPGAYSLLLSDKKQCADSATYTVGISGSNITIQSSQIPEYCGNGNGQASVDVVNNHSGPVTFAWQGGGSNSFKNFLSTGSYIVTVTDSVGCIKIDTVVVSSVTSTNIQAQTNRTPDACGQGIGSIEVHNTSGGIGLLKYQWSNGKSANRIDSLMAGIFSVTLTDSVSCFMILTDTVKDQNAPLVMLNSIDLGCYGDSSGRISVAVTGGISPYHFAWSTGSADSVLIGLQAGTFRVTVTDSLGCTTSDSSRVSQPPLLVADTIGALTPSSGACHGSAFVTPNGGVPPYGYLWSNPGAATDSMPYNLCPGINTVTITDLNGCQAVANIVIELVGGADEYGSMEFKLYPNPVYDQLVIESRYGEIECILRDITGRMIGQYYGNQQLKIKMPELSGVYSVEVITRTGGGVYRVIKY